MKFFCGAGALFVRVCRSVFGRATLVRSCGSLFGLFSVRGRSGSASFVRLVRRALAHEPLRPGSGCEARPNKRQTEPALAHEPLRPSSGCEAGSVGLRPPNNEQTSFSSRTGTSGSGGVAGSAAPNKPNNEAGQQRTTQPNNPRTIKD